MYIYLFISQKDGTPSPLEIYPNGIPEDQKRFVNFRLNQFMDFRAKTDNFGSFVSYLNNGISSHVPEAGSYLGLFLKSIFMKYCILGFSNAY